MEADRIPALPNPLRNSNVVNLSFIHRTKGHPVVTEAVLHLSGAEQEDDL